MGVKGMTCFFSTWQHGFTALCINSGIINTFKKHTCVSVELEQEIVKICELFMVFQ